MKKSELQTMVVSELKALARKMNIKMPVRARKADIVDFLCAAFNQRSGKSAGNAVKQQSAAKNGVVKKNAVPKKQIAPKRIPIEKPAPEPPSAAREWKMPPGTEEPLMAQERVSDAKYYTGPGREPSSGGYSELPLGYGEEKIALMVRDPYLAYVYWEITPSRVQREKSWFGWNGKPAVRIYDVTGV